MAIAAARSSMTDAALGDIQRYIANPPKTSVVLEITPPVANAILKTYNIENRGLKARKIKNIVTALQHGEWLVTGETIKFSPRRLIDGQNRLTACVESGKPIVSHVVFGIPDEAFAIIDTGASRTPGDILHIAGVRDPNAIAHIITWIYTLETAPGGRSKLSLSPNQILHLHRTRYSDVGENLGWGRQLQKTTNSPTTRGALLHYAFSRFGGPEKAEHFMLTWIDPEVEGGAPQARLLRRRLTQIARVVGGALPVTQVYSLAIKAWNAYIQDQPISVADLKWGAEEPLPLVLPRPRETAERRAAE